MKRYEIIDHTADVGIKAYGKDMSELFSNAAFGMFNIIADLEGLKPSTSISIRTEASDYEQLLINWLDDLLYNFYTKGIIFCDFKINTLDSNYLQAEAHGRLIGAKKSRLKTEVKAATFHELKIEEAGGGYQAQIIFDV